MARNTTYALFAALMMTGTAAAQTVPAGQSCGGLFCDMGLVGHKVPMNADGSPPSPAAMAAAEAADPTRLPCHDFLCRAFGQKDAEAASVAAPVQPVAAVEPPAPAKHQRTVKHKHVAHAETAKAEGASEAK